MEGNITSSNKIEESSKGKTTVVVVTGNSKSREIHLASCPWLGLMKEENKIIFQSLTAAVDRGYNPCDHCLPEPLYKSILDKEREQASTLTSQQPNTVEEDDTLYFQSKIYNNHLKGAPTFSILSEEKDFGLNEAIAYAKEKKIKYIFLVFAGQQGVFLGNIPLGQTSRTDPEGDELFCRALTGGNRLPDNGLWRGRYKVHTTKSYSSTASRLFDKYKENAIIFDILNTKYNWAMTKKKKAKTLDYMLNLFYHNFYTKIMNDVKPKIFISGFSRGGCFSINFAEALSNLGLKNQIAAVVTVDPVINPGTERKTMVKKYAKKKLNGEWTYVNSRPVTKKLKEYFPVLKSLAGVRYYNVFQRRAMEYFFEESEAIPVGSAVDGAVSPLETNWPDKDTLKPIKNGKPFNQYDASVDRHTPDMLNKYAHWIDFVATSILPM